jgi:hypothetical protein
LIFCLVWRNFITGHPLSAAECRLIGIFIVIAPKLKIFPQAKHHTKLHLFKKTRVFFIIYFFSLPAMEKMKKGARLVLIYAQEIFMDLHFSLQFESARKKKRTDKRNEMQ